MASLSKGANLPVDAASVRAELTWTTADDDPGVDTSALLVTADGRVRSDDDLVFYNQPGHPSGAVRHLGRQGDCDSVRVALDRVEADVERVVLAASTDGGSFGELRDLRLRLVDTADGGEIAEYAMTATTETAFIGGELYRRGDGWKFRAVGQGYAAGLATLVADFGIAIAEEVPPPPGPPAPEPSPTPPAPVPPPAPPAPVEPPAPPAPPEPVPAPALPVDPVPDVVQRSTHPVDVLAQRTQLVDDVLTEHGAADLTARVVLVLDASLTMGWLYEHGVVGRLVERMAAVAARLDEGREVRAWTFAANPARLPDLDIDELPQWIDLHVRVGSTHKQRGLRPGQIDMGKVGAFNDEPKAIAEVHRFVRRLTDVRATLVLFLSDGGITRHSEIERKLRAAATHPVYWQFVGLAETDYGVLPYLGRTMDSVGFFAVDDIEALPDPVLYDRLLSGFARSGVAARVLRD